MDTTITLLKPDSITFRCLTCGWALTLSQAGARTFLDGAQRTGKLPTHTKDGGTMCPYDRDGNLWADWVVG